MKKRGRKKKGRLGKLQLSQATSGENGKTTHASFTPTGGMTERQQIMLLKKLMEETADSGDTSEDSSSSSSEEEVSRLRKRTAASTTKEKVNTPKSSSISTESPPRKKIKKPLPQIQSQPSQNSTSQSNSPILSLKRKPGRKVWLYCILFEISLFF